MITNYVCSNIHSLSLPAKRTLASTRVDVHVGERERVRRHRVVVLALIDAQRHVVGRRVVEEVKEVHMLRNHLQHVGRDPVTLVVRSILVHVHAWVAKAPLRHLTLLEHGLRSLACVWCNEGWRDGWGIAWV